MWIETSRAIGFRRSAPGASVQTVRVDRWAGRGHAVAKVPRRFQPRLAAGFGDETDSPLEPFDRRAPLWLAECASAAGAAVLGLVALLGLLVIVAG